MKRTLTIIIACLVALAPLSAAGNESIEQDIYNSLVAKISRVRAPVVSGRYVIFTAAADARHTAIAFEHENYTQMHSFKRLIRKGADGKAEKDANGKEIPPVLFYIAEVPPDHSELRYRMVIDGLWTTDPLNANVAYDYDNGMNVSTLAVQKYEIFKTENVVNKGQVRFTYEGTPGEEIRLAGTFNNWDPFMYDMEETSPGKYELLLPLPAGTWYYAYFDGTTQVPDGTNGRRVYTKDGRIASVVTVN